MNFSIGDFHFGIYVYEWDIVSRIFFFIVALALALAIATFLLWIGRKRS